MSLHPGHFGRLALAALVASILPAAASAQEGATVSGSGSAAIKRPASKLRMSIILSAKGKTLEEALGRLKERRELATAHLKKPQADTSSAKFTDTALGAESGQRAEMQRMMRMARGGRVPKALEVPASVTVNCTLTADWPLQYESSDELLIVSQKLQEKIREADLGGLKEPKQLTPQEQELEEELAGTENENYSPYGEPQAKPGEPSFLYVATITKEERSTALAEAFGKAKDQASRLAQAAGLQLGALVEVSGQASADDFEGLDPYTAYQLRQRGQLGVDGADNEATSATPGHVAAVANVQAKFRAK